MAYFRVELPDLIMNHTNFGALMRQSAAAFGWDGNSAELFTLRRFLGAHWTSKEVQGYDIGYVIEGGETAARLCAAGLAVPCVGYISDEEKEALHSASLYLDLHRGLYLAELDLRALSLKSYDTDMCRAALRRTRTR